MCHSVADSLVVSNDLLVMVKDKVNNCSQIVQYLLVELDGYKVLLFVNILWFGLLDNLFVC